MYEVSTMVVTNYMNDFLPEPDIHWPKEEFEKRTYARWAAGEILKRIMDRPEDDPVEIIDEFSMEVMYYSQNTEGTPNHLIFETAFETAEQIGCLFL